MSAQIYYGLDYCDYSGRKDVAGIEINLTNAIEVEDLTPDHYYIGVPYNLLNSKNMKNTITILRYLSGANILSNLFKYKGKLNITSAKVTYSDNSSEQCTIKKVVDYADFLDIKAEDMNILPKKLNKNMNTNINISKFKILDPVVPNIKGVQGSFILEDETEYIGLCHYHQDTGTYMSGGTHTEDSQLLYFKDEMPDGSFKVRQATVVQFAKNMKAKQHAKRKLFKKVLRPKAKSNVS